MLKRRLLFMGIAVGIILLSLVTGGSSSVTAQDDPTVEPLFSVDLEEGQHPIAPAFVRLLRITMAEGSSSPLHTHPGPEFGFIERGTLMVQVNGSAIIATAENADAEGTPTPQQEAPTNAEFELGPGDLITYLSQTPMTFRNAASDPVSILAAVILPAGSQHPPGVTYLDGQPAADAFDGVAPEILGDGVATVLPVGGATVSVDRLRLGPGEPIPAFAESTLLSLESGRLDFTVVGGKVQVSRTATPGPQPDTAPETEVSLAKGDGVFFPLGMREVDRGNTEGELVLLRMTISTTSGAEGSTDTDTGTGEIRIIASEIDEGPVAGPTDGTPEADASPGPDDPTPTPEVPVIGEGALVTVNSEGVNIRSGAGTSFDIVTQVFTGDQLRVTGESEEADGFEWWPVELAGDASVSGYIADEFIDIVES